MSEAAHQPDRSPGIFSWNELVSPDAAGSIEFYSSLFGWGIEEIDMGDFTYRMFKAGDRPVGGLLQRTAEMGDCPPHWLSYVTVDDLEVSTAKALELGATMVKDITDAGMGRFSILIDPQGAGIALWQFTEQADPCAPPQ